MLTLQFLRNPGKFKSCSAFAPISNPINSPWGQKAFVGYLGEEDLWKWNDYDATELVRKYKGPLDILIDVVCLLTLADVSNRQGHRGQFLQARPTAARKLRRSSESAGP